MGWLLEAADTSLDSADISVYTSGLVSGALGVWCLWDSGIIGLSRTTKVLYVEFLVGKDLTEHRDEILVWLKKTAEGRRIEALPSRPGMIRRLEQMGFKPVSTLMRLVP